MKPNLKQWTNILLLNLGLVLGCGCETAASRAHREEQQRSDAEAARVRNQIQAEKDREKSRVRLEKAKEHREKIAANWGKLKAGMSQEEVEAQIGSLYSLSSIKARSESAFSASTGKIVQTLTIENPICFLVFEEGKLSKWELKK